MYATSQGNSIAVADGYIRNWNREFGLSPTSTLAATMLTAHYNTTLDLLEAEHPNYIAYVPVVFYDDLPVSR
jgi:hypothetical protein